MTASSGADRRHPRSGAAERRSLPQTRSPIDPSANSPTGAPVAPLLRPRRNVAQSALRTCIATVDNNGLVRYQLIDPVHDLLAGERLQFRLRNPASLYECAGGFGFLPIALVLRSCDQHFDRITFQALPVAHQPFSGRWCIAHHWLLFSLIVSIGHATEGSAGQVNPTASPPKRGANATPARITSPKSVSNTMSTIASRSFRISVASAGSGTTPTTVPVRSSTRAAMALPGPAHSSNTSRRGALLIVVPPSLRASLGHHHIRLGFVAKTRQPVEKVACGSGLPRQRAVCAQDCGGLASHRGPGRSRDGIRGRNRCVFQQAGPFPRRAGDGYATGAGTT